MTLHVPCPRCGPRPFMEFTFGSELRAIEAETLEEDFARVFLRANIAGPQWERWYHAHGCGRWLTVRRDTTTNQFD